VLHRVDTATLAELALPTPDRAFLSHRLEKHLCAVPVPAADGDRTEHFVADRGCLASEP
jgi:hypothetical protein